MEGSVPALGRTIVLVLLLSTAACADGEQTDQSATPDQAQPSSSSFDPSDCALELVPDAGHAIENYEPRSSTWTVPVIESLDVFARERTPRDEPPSNDCMIYLLQSRAEPGRVADFESARLALSGLPEGRSVFLFPTDSEALCVALTGPGGFYYCTDPNLGPTAAWWNPRGGDPYAFGELENEVTRVRCAMSGKEEGRAEVGENSFYCQFPQGTPDSKFELTLEYADGSTRRIRIDPR